METETLSKTSLAEVPLEDIQISETNKMFRDENDFTIDSLQELVNSILENGLAQPILLRPNGKAGKYILVAGERRFHASKFIMAAHKERKTIPAYIRNLNDEQAFDLQLTENVERKDIHPMREARAYKFLHETKKWTTAEIALRFAKGETYVLQRMKLNTLIEEAAKDFTNNLMSLGHAILIARLTPEDQKEVIKRCSSKQRQNKYYESIHELEDFIQDNIVRDLKEATFDTNDPKLIPKAGACVNCPKRSGHAALLFPDIKDKDRCFDGACFAMKRGVALFAKVKDLVEKEPDIIFLFDYWASNRGQKVPQQIGSFLSGQKIKPLNSNEDFDTWGHGSKQKKITGFWLNGDKAGHKGQVFIAGKSDKDSKGSSPEKIDAKEAIERIKERTKRAAELDDEKIHAKVIELLETNKDWMDERTIKPTIPEKALIANIIFNHADYQVRAEISKILKLGRMSDQKKEIEVFKKLTDMDIAWMVRRIAVKQYSSSFNHNSSEGLLMRELAPIYNVPLKDIEKEQAEIRVKREARARERIAQLNPKKKSKKAKL